MTTYYEEKSCCGVCGSENEYTGIGSTNSFGSPDLDTRPPEMRRSTMFAWVQRCPDCGFCSSDVSKSRPGDQLLVNGADYKAQLNDPTYPDLANKFLCKAICDRAAGNYSDATWDFIHAAWACDDSGHADQAKVCRKTAADLLELSQKQGQKVAGQDRAEFAMLVDLLRRSGQITRAKALLASKQGGLGDDVIGRVLVFEVALLEKNDVSCHTISEALGEAR